LSQLLVLLRLLFVFIAARLFEDQIRCRFGVLLQKVFVKGEIDRVLVPAFVDQARLAQLRRMMGYRRRRDAQLLRKRLPVQFASRKQDENPEPCRIG
jgi:hypothetical protein